MHAAEVHASLDWGWTSYKALGWATAKNGRKLYGANFRADVSTLGWRTLHIQFWARRPILALHEIVNSGRDPNEFNGKEIN